MPTPEPGELVVHGQPHEQERGTGSTLGELRGRRRRSIALNVGRPLERIAERIGGVAGETQ